MVDVEGPVGKWWAQHGHWPETDPPVPMPDTHKHYAEHGGPLEASFKALGYVPVPPPGSAPEPVAEVVEPEPVAVPVVEPLKVARLPRRKRS